MFDGPLSRAIVKETAENRFSAELFSSLERSE
jgi:hypothetical protein